MMRRRLTRSVINGLMFHFLLFPLNRGRNSDFLLERDKKTIVPFVWKIDGFSKPSKDPKGKLYFRYYNAKFPKPRKYADFEYTQPRYFFKLTTPDIPVCNEIEDMDASSEGVVPTGDVISGS